METVASLIEAVCAGQPAAYEVVVRRFQDMAVGYAYSILGDMHLAEDAAQEAFICAYYELPTLRDPAAFPGWLKRIVFKQADRCRRRSRVQLVALDEAEHCPGADPDPAQAVEAYEMKAAVGRAIAALPEHFRVVVVLFYLSQYSLREISAFLEIPEATVKTRLYAARKLLKERMLTMIKDHLPEGRPSRDDQFTERVMRLFKATAAGDSAAVGALLSDTVDLASAVGTEWSDYWHGQASALHIAVMYNRRDVIDLLLAHGADINAREPKSNWSALHFAVDLGWADALPDYNPREMIDFLLSRGAREDIFVPLWLGDDEAVKAFLESDPASANAIGPLYATPLCFVHSIKMAELLLDYGADMHFQLQSAWCKERGLDTPLRWAASRPELPVFRFLLKHADSEIDIFLASALGDISAISSTLESNSALVNAKTDAQHILLPDMTALHIAAHYRRVDVVKLLLQQDADVNATASAFNAMTPLHLAVWLSGGDENVIQTDVPRLLLEHSADLTLRDSKHNWTPLGWAEAKLEDEEKDRSQVAALLRQFGGQL